MTTGQATMAVSSLQAMVSVLAVAGAGFLFLHSTCEAQAFGSNGGIVAPRGDVPTTAGLQLIEGGASRATTLDVRTGPDRFRGLGPFRGIVVGRPTTGGQRFSGKYRDGAWVVGQGRNSPAFGSRELSTPPRARPVAFPKGQVTDLVTKLAPEYRLEPRLVLAVVEAESDFNPGALSVAGARGLMQLLPQTANRFGVADVWDPEENLRGGMAYLRWLLDYFNGDIELALAGYNAGEQAVVRHGGIPPYDETRAYVKRIAARLGL
ncbi:hypothetical protein CKO41_06715 [Thiococcus pfennigii]|nr:hypothetical protein [Thiococcus pfennigii]MBK1731490.1 hypothetical protein [Thiococcus pfennigii]